MTTRTKFDPKAEHERRLASAMSRCVFFTGVQHEVCEAGVQYDSLKTSPPTCLPCLPNHASPTVAMGVCEKVRMTTREEAEAEIAAADISYQRIRSRVQLMRARIESVNAPSAYDFQPQQTEFAL